MWGEAQGVAPQVKRSNSARKACRCPDRIRVRDDWFDYRLGNDPRFLQRIEQARKSFRAGGGTRLEDVPK